MKGKLVAITGGGRGIGYAIAERFADKGANLAIADIDLDNARQAAAKLEKKGVHAEPCHLDVRDIGAVEAFFQGLKQRYGGLDILVNNAGIQIRNPSIDYVERDWDALMSVNLKAAFFCSKYAARIMEGRPGSIVNISSGTSTQTTPGRAPYVISKAGINAMTAVLAAEWASRDIRVNAVAPGWILTDMVQDGLRLGIINNKMLMSAIPFRRFADPLEIADAVVYLAGDKASYVTGQTLFVDGGWSALGLPQEEPS